MVNKKTTLGTSAADFGTAAADGAPLQPKLNRHELIKRVKMILQKNCVDGNYQTCDGESLEPTANQRKLLTTVANHDVTFVDGPFGTGKTIWTVLAGLTGLIEKKFNRIAVTAPAVEAGERLGFLPGDKDAKMFEHVNQILEAFDDWIGKDIRIQLQNTGVIEIAPHAFLRGRTMKKTFFILDECQNASGKQLITALSRLGHDSSFVFMGDNKQNDRTEGDSAFVQFINRFTAPKYLESGYIGHAILGKEDVRRHPLLKMMVEEGDDRPLEGFESHFEGRAVAVTPRRANGNGNGVNGASNHPSPS